jgi:hypothetical protein
LHKLVKSIDNYIIDIEKNVADKSVSKRTWRPFVKRNFPPPCNQVFVVDDDEEEEQEKEHDDDYVGTSEINIIWDSVDSIFVMRNIYLVKILMLFKLEVKVLLPVPQPHLPLFPPRKLFLKMKQSLGP